MSTALISIDNQGTLDALKTIDDVSKELRDDSSASFIRAVKTAKALTLLRAEMSKASVLDAIMSIQGTSLGFRTDKPDGYDPIIVRDAFIEAVLRGLRPIGNEFNIISGRFYCTKEGFSRLLRDLPGFTDLRITMDVPKAAGDRGAIVKASATWKYQGNADRIEREIPVRVNGGMGADAILGKAERKLKSAIYHQVTGTTLSDGEAGDDAGAINITPKGPAADINAKLAAEGQA